jgi:hypothetical protein
MYVFVVLSSQVKRNIKLIEFVLLLITFTGILRATLLFIAIILYDITLLTFFFMCKVEIVVIPMCYILNCPCSCCPMLLFVCNCN